MMHCPFCKSPAHTRTSRYLSETVKQLYYQCTNILCSATFRTMESVDSVIQPPSVTDAEGDEFIAAHSGKVRKQNL
ncbi:MULTISPECIES: ogr/Delta-like zinc finger family protein [Citrobacter]|jgi:transcriptional regulator NrdR family protein|uniref:ogr/Delta-like zinc finger family protein n=1 Tax=Citrobacter TaxID=544 RepID=UPI00109355A9|nr:MULTISPECIES: ogr/Delta-like zinc finger family protein [Citrobacter]MBJ9085827.1 ogr/Delta-like zinc finger family protein [Citrobacter freundii]MCS3464858.1 transcriptional regulator NrdR family protein [Citrobacter sp. JUb117]MDM3330575.1 ogr/Delta-like zinc finger family protein [Citrobacter sp. Cb130]MDM3453207.1 ogr/Delta-like zinc finger family protein [Citrobacter sp. Cb028]QCA19692.1 transcriptional regulator [Citrobacter freundii]